jgi:2-polyprenyl-6-methoxyphenol hydroxylase-like FAD-dependent oxidoreductase
MSDVVVIGAGIGGLAFALGAARAGFAVTVLERDTTEPAGSPDEVFDTWRRRGTPQARLVHQFHPRTWSELACNAPDVLDDVLCAGADKVDLRRRLGDALEEEDQHLQALAVRRPVIEAVLRHAVVRQDGIDLRCGSTVGGPVMDVGGCPRVRGVVADDVILEAGLVVDAAGRRSPVRRWLTELGFTAPPVHRMGCGIVYYGRYFRLRPGVDLPPLKGALTEAGDLGYMGYGIGKSDNRCYAVLLVVPGGDTDLRVLGRVGAWDAATAAIPATAPFVSPEVGEPIMDPTPMAGLENTIAPWYDAGRPLIAGLVHLADAWATTDPAYGWGASLALAQGFALARSLEATAPDTDAAVESFLAASVDEVTQRFNLACSQNRIRNAGWAGERDLLSVDDLEQESVLFALTAGGRHDPVLARASMRWAGLLALPDELWADGEAMTRAHRFLESHPYDPTRVARGPSRGELLALITGHV